MFMFIFLWITNIWLGTCEDSSSSSLVWPEHRLKDDDSDESPLYKAVDLVELSSSITERFLKPSGNPDFFIRDLFIFRNELQDMLHDIKSNKSEALESFHALKSNNGPIHLNNIRDNNVLLQNFNWTSVELQEIDEVMGHTKKLWNDLKQEVAG
uniref:HPt domain-containing protein n=1 Tax=Clastoptera arizonana TaxID=38151 RepID=A0A1B6C4R2_9HEMI